MGIGDRLDKIKQKISKSPSKRSSVLPGDNSDSPSAKDHDWLSNPDSIRQSGHSNEEAHNVVMSEGHQDDIADSFEQLVANTAQPPYDDSLHAHSPATQAVKHVWMKRFVPGLEKLANTEHVGNFVATTRGPNPQKVFESMPIYARLGMHLLFYGRAENKLLHYKRVEDLLEHQSIKEGKIFDQERGAQEHITAFIKTYRLEDTLDQLLLPSIADYKTFNQFFYRKLKPGARPVDEPENPLAITSAADCRLTVWESVHTAKEFWIKGQRFTIPNLLEWPEIAELPEFKDGACLAIFRLAPQDYHRFHSPVKATLGANKPIPGQYYTVNPQAVNEDFNVFTDNKRQVQLLNCDTGSGTTRPVAFVAVGALLVGSINFTKHAGETVERGDELGYFAYGGSTCICVFPKDSVRWDEDLINNSKGALETVVAVGNHIGTWVN